MTARCCNKARHCMGRTGHLLVIAAAVGLFAPSLGAVTVSGRVIRQCCREEPAAGMLVVAYESWQPGSLVLGHCAFTIGAAREEEEVGSAVTQADGTYRIEYNPRSRECPFDMRVLVEVYDGPSRSPLLGESGALPRAESVVLADVDIGFSGCLDEDARFAFSLEGPSVVVGLPGETVSFDVFVLLEQFVSTSCGADNWLVILKAEGATVTAATVAGTEGASRDADPPGLVCPNPSVSDTRVVIEDVSQPVAYSALQIESLFLPSDCRGDPRNRAFPASPSPQRILHVTLSAVVPPTGVESSCRVFFCDDCLRVTPDPDFLFCRPPFPPCPPVPLVNSCSVLGINGHLDLSDLRVALRSSNETPFRRADFNQSGAVDISDAVATFGNLFLGAAAPSCLDAADSNGDGSLDISDGVNTLNFLFTGGQDIPAPGPVACGLPEESRLGCDAFLCP